MIQNRNSYKNYVPLIPFMPEDPRVGYGYVPYQVEPDYFEDMSEIFYHGTLFPDLVTPYYEFLDRVVL